MKLTLPEAIEKLNGIFEMYSDAQSQESPLIGDDWKAGKVYEAYILSVALNHLVHVEGFQAELIGSSKVHLKSSPGPINAHYPHFRLQRGAEIVRAWTDVEFSTLSYHHSSKTGKPGKAHRHELDIVVTPDGVHGYPTPEHVLVGIECKNTTFEKHMARAALGVRRELSLLRPPVPTVFQHWPRPSVPADPPSVLLVYSTDAGVEVFNGAGGLFGVDFVHEPMP